MFRRCCGSSASLVHRATSTSPLEAIYGGLEASAFRTLNPHGRIPVLEDDGLAVWESHAVLRYLAARYGQGEYWADDPAVRAPIDGWMDWAETTLQPSFLGGVFWGYYRTPEAQRDWPAINANLATSAALFGLLDEDPVRPSVPTPTGETFSLAEIAAGTNLYRYFELKIERPPLPNVEAWYNRLKGRAAYRDHVMVAFDDLRGQRGNAGR